MLILIVSHPFSLSIYIVTSALMEGPLMLLNPQSVCARRPGSHGLLWLVAGTAKLLWF